MGKGRNRSKYIVFDAMDNDVIFGAPEIVTIQNQVVQAAAAAGAKS